MTNPKQIAGEERTLLEMAARAAGHYVAGIADDGHSLLLIGVQEPWNPLESDADAFRLAVKLRMCLDCVTGADVVEYYCNDRIQFAEIDITADDYLAAVRLAITRAAASIGASMKEEQA